YVRAVPAGTQHDRLPGLRVLPELALTVAADEQLRHLLRGQLVRGHALRDRGPVAAVTVTVVAIRTLRARCPALQIGPVAADPDHHLPALLVGEQRDRVDLPGVDLAQFLGDQLLQPAGAGDRALHAQVA